MKFNPAYSKGRPYYRQGKAYSGVYLIKHRGRVQYVGYSFNNVVKTAYRHFQRWEDPQQFRATFPKTAELLILPVRKQAVEKVEAYLIGKYQPEKNTNIPRIFLPDNYEPPAEVPF